MLRKARTAKKLSIPDVMRRLHDLGVDVSDSHLYRMELGNPLRQLELVETLCQMLGVKWVLGENGSGQTKKGVHDEVSRRGRNTVARVAG